MVTRLGEKSTTVPTSLIHGDTFGACVRNVCIKQRNAIIYNFAYRSPRAFYIIISTADAFATVAANVLVATSPSTTPPSLLSNTPPRSFTTLWCRATWLYVVSVIGFAIRQKTTILSILTLIPCLHSLVRHENRKLCACTHSSGVDGGV